MDVYYSMLSNVSVIRAIQGAHAACGVLVVAVIMIVDDSDAECPDAYWDGPSKKCASFIASVLLLEHAAADQPRLNRTCASVFHAHSCSVSCLLQH